MRTNIGEAPFELDNNELIVQVVKNRGNTFDVEVPPSEQARLRTLLPQVESAATTEPEATTEPATGAEPAPEAATEAGETGETQVTTTENGNQTIVVGLSGKLRNQFFIKRGGYAVASIEARGKLAGEITNVCSDKREWQKQSYWPQEFRQVETSYDSMDLPPSDEEYSEEESEEEEEPAVQFIHSN